MCAYTSSPWPCTPSRYIRTKRIYDFLEEEKASGMMVRQYVNLKEGISKDNSKKINKLIKEYEK